MQTRKLIAATIAAVFLAGTVIPERVHASPADGIIGLAAGMIIGGALSQGQPQPRYRTYRTRRVYTQPRAPRRPSAAQQVRQELRKPNKASDDPFASESSSRSTRYR